MIYITGFGRDQLLLLPEAVDDYVDTENPVRFIDAFVDGLDLAAAGFARVEAKATSGLCAGRPVEAVYLRLSEPSAVEPPAGARGPSQHRGRLAAARPQARLQDHRRLSARQRQGVPRRISSVRAAMPAARSLRRELLAVDGTRIKAANNKDRNFTRSSLRAFIRAADERLDDYLARLDTSDVEDGASAGGARTKNLAEKIEALRKKGGR